jgi:hypothetical protein
MIGNLLFSKYSPIASRNAAFHQIRRLATPAADRYKVLVVGGGSTLPFLNNESFNSKSQGVADYRSLDKSTIDSRQPGNSLVMGRLPLPTVQQTIITRQVSYCRECSLANPPFSLDGVHPFGLFMNLWLDADL